MKRSRYLLACAVSVFASTSVIFGQDTVAFGLNLAPVAPTLPDGAAAAFGARSSSGIFAGIATLRISDPLLTTNPGWSAGTTDRPGVNSGPGFGQDAVSVRIGFPWFGTFDNRSSAPLIHSDVVTARPSDSFVIVRVWDSLPPSDSGWASAATGRPGLFLDRGVPPNFQVQPSWLDISGGVGLKIQEESSRRGGVQLPPIPPLPSNRDSGLVAVPEPGTWGLIALGAAVLFQGRRRRR